jgi:hypothetical protein
MLSCAICSTTNGGRTVADERLSAHVKLVRLGYTRVTRLGLVTMYSRSSAVAPNRLGGGNHQEKQEIRSHNDPQVSLDAITQTWNHSQSYYDDESMMEMSGRCLLRLTRMSSMSKCQEGEPQAGQTLFIDGLTK